MIRVYKNILDSAVFTMSAVGPPPPTASAAREVPAHLQIQMPHINVLTNAPAAGQRLAAARRRCRFPRRPPCDLRGRVLLGRGAGLPARTGRGGHFRRLCSRPHAGTHLRTSVQRRDRSRRGGPGRLAMTTVAHLALAPPHPLRAARPPAPACSCCTAPLRCHLATCALCC